MLSASQPIWSLPVEAVPAALQSTPQGLSQREAQRRLERFGANRLPSLRRRPLVLRFIDQLVHFMALLLWVAGGLAFAAGTPQLGWAIWAVVLINGVFSFWQDYQAERTLAALKRSLPRQVRLFRDGVPTQLSAEVLVPGDRILLEEGDRVPADARLIRAVELSLDLSVLTGESQAVARHAEAIPLPRNAQAALIPTRERANLALAGTTVAAGRAEAIVYATGGETEFGHVAHLTAATPRGVTTLEEQVGHIVRTITVIALVMGVITFSLSLLFVGMAPLESLVFAVGIIVANVPEGLLPTVTLALAINVQRMASQKALVRRLSAVETLGSVSVICSDKTGTLTCNRMAVEATWLPGASGRQPGEPGAEQELLAGACLCSNARLDRSGEAPLAIGDPTETAMWMASLDRDLNPDALQQRHPRHRELPFDSHRRRMSVVVERDGALELITKGAPLELLAHCAAEGRAEAVAANDDLAARGYRVIAVARRPLDPSLLAAPADQLERELTLVGLLGLYDPPRPEVPEAIRQCHQAGIKVTMVTGDYGLTAQAIARQIGLLDLPAGGEGPPQADPVRVIQGNHLDLISDVQLRQLLKYRNRLVFARMAPEQKLRLVQAYRSLGEVVAVTGDGVNDAPALRAADVGVAMGLEGTDVAREAADVVLLDDNFATIVTAVRYGRGVVANIRKFLPYVLASNVAEMTPFLAMVAFQIPAALTVLQILAVDLGTDLLPALGLGAEAPEAGLMHQPPRRRTAPLLDRPLMLRAYLVLGLAEALVAMAAYLFTWRLHGVSWAELRQAAPLLLHGQAGPVLTAIQHQASSVAFTCIVAGQIGVALACRSERRSAFVALVRQGWRTNPLLWFGVAVEVVFTALLLVWPPLSRLVAMAPFDRQLWPLVLLAPLLVMLADDLRKRRLAP
nr:cation-transporting P-type ATPase [Cyanobium sp. FACHB-13342]